MRPKYVKLIKEYINAKPDYKDAIKEIKANILVTGATEEEFTQALKDLAITPGFIENQQEEKDYSEFLEKKTKDSKKQKKKKKPHKLSQFIEIEVIGHAVFLVLFLIIGVVFISSPHFNNEFSLPALHFQAQKENSANTAITNKRSEKESIIPQVYAGGQEVNATKIFSYPVSDITLVVSGNPKKEVLGFFPYWMMDVQEKISLDALTTVSLFGVETDGDGNIITTRDQDIVDGGWAMWNNPKLNDFIIRAKKKQITLALTIKAFNNTNIERLVDSDTAQKQFISNALYLINSKNLDGINLDFEYVGTPAPQTRHAFTRLVMNLRAEMKRQAPNSTLTIDTYATAAVTPGLFDLELLVEQVDAFVIMGYDIHTPQGSPGAVAPMGGNLNIQSLTQSYLERISPDKIILAVPYYGYDWPVTVAAHSERIGDASTLAYAEIAEVSKQSAIYWDEITQTPWYRYNDDSKTAHEVHFENTRSLGIKYDYVNKKDLKGIGIWALGYDGLNPDLRSLIIEKFAQ